MLSPGSITNSVPDPDKQVRLQRDVQRIAIENISSVAQSFATTVAGLDTALAASIMPEVLSTSAGAYTTTTTFGVICTLTFTVPAGHSRALINAQSVCNINSSHTTSEIGYSKVTIAGVDGQVTEGSWATATDLGMLAANSANHSPDLREGRPSPSPCQAASSTDPRTADSRASTRLRCSSCEPSPQSGPWSSSSDGGRGPCLVLSKYEGIERPRRRQDARRELCDRVPLPQRVTRPRIVPGLANYATAERLTSRLGKERAFEHPKPSGGGTVAHTFEFR